MVTQLNDPQVNMGRGIVTEPMVMPCFVCGELPELIKVHGGKVYYSHSVEDDDNGEIHSFWTMHRDSEVSSRKQWNRLMQQYIERASAVNADIQPLSISQCPLCGIGPQCETDGMDGLDEKGHYYCENDGHYISSSNKQTVGDQMERSWNYFVREIVEKARKAQCET